MSLLTPAAAIFRMFVELFQIVAAVNDARVHQGGSF